MDRRGLAASRPAAVATRHRVVMATTVRMAAMADRTEAMEVRTPAPAADTTAVAEAATVVAEEATAADTAKAKTTATQKRRPSGRRFLAS
jgi:hypothetical protein